MGEGGRHGRPPMRNIEKSCEGVHDPPTLEKFENIYGVYSIMRQNVCEGDSSRASICMKILK